MLHFLDKRWLTLLPPLVMLLALTVGAALASSWIVAGIAGSFLVTIVLLAVVLLWREQKRHVS